MTPLRNHVDRKISDTSMDLAPYLGYVSISSVHFPICTSRHCFNSIILNISPWSSPRDWSGTWWTLQARLVDPEVTCDVRCYPTVCSAFKKPVLTVTLTYPWVSLCLAVISSPVLSVSLTNSNEWVSFAENSTHRSWKQSPKANIHHECWTQHLNIAR